MTNNYFRITLGSKSRFVFFNDHDSLETCEAYSTASATADMMGGKLVIWRRAPHIPGWDLVPVVGENAAKRVGTGNDPICA